MNSSVLPGSAAVSRVEKDYTCAPLHVFDLMEKKYLNEQRSQSQMNFLQRSNRPSIA